MFRCVISGERAEISRQFTGGILSVWWCGIDIQSTQVPPSVQSPSPDPCAGFFDDSCDMWMVTAWIYSMLGLDVSPV